MEPFASYPGGGRVLLGRPRRGDETFRNGYGLNWFRTTRQRLCAYCGFDLLSSYHAWLLAAQNHVVPRQVAIGLGIPADLYEDAINLVMACSGCNGFGNRYQVVMPAREEIPWTLDEFCDLRDRVFQERSILVERRRLAEIESYRRWVSLAEEEPTPAATVRPDAAR